MGYNFANIGTLYLLEAIDIICNSKNYIKTMSNLEVNVYTKIAKKYETSSKTVKSNIVKATNNMDKTRKLKKDKYVILSKYTPKSVIYYIVENIKNP